MSILWVLCRLPVNSVNICQFSQRGATSLEYERLKQKTREEKLALENARSEEQLRKFVDSTAATSSTATTSTAPASENNPKSFGMPSLTPSAKECGNAAALEKPDEVARCPITEPRSQCATWSPSNSRRSIRSPLLRPLLREPPVPALQAAPLFRQTSRTSVRVASASATRATRNTNARWPATRSTRARRVLYCARRDRWSQWRPSNAWSASARSPSGAIR